MGLSIIFWFLTLNISNMYLSYNIDYNSPFIKSIESADKSLFGFSLSTYTSHNTKKKYILVGSPTDQTDNPAIKRSGAFYSCPLTKEYKDCTQRFVNEKSENSLFGYSLESDNNDAAIYTCATRFLQSLSNVKYVEGNCWELSENYTEIDTISNNDCKKSINDNPRDYEFRNCLTGGALISLGKKELLVTAPYSYEGRGLLINSRFQAESNGRVYTYLRFDKLMSKYQLTGLSIAVGKIYRNSGVRTIILGAPGLPHSNLTNIKMGFGQVVLIKLVGNELSLRGLIFGETFASAFGYSVLAMDLNGDGYDELIVGAPYTSNNRGRVFIYWNSETEETNEGGYQFPLTVKSPLMIQSSKKTDNGQYGNCLENIGDINKDSLLDLAVGSPFEDDGRGSVYIYLGNKDGLITLSQKIDASQIDPNFRGFGFSLNGKQEDLDGNIYPDLVVGAVVSGHTIGLRTRPLIRIYAENMLPKKDFLIPYNLGSLSTCNIKGVDVTCIEIRISLFYYLLGTNMCPLTKESKTINIKVDLDKQFLTSSQTRRVYFDDNSNLLKETLSIECKPPTSPSTSSQRRLKILFPSSVFFNLSLPIEIVLRWSVIELQVPKRDYQAGQDMVDLLQYPILDRSQLEMTNQILFGEGCGPDSCKPILTLQAKLDLQKTDDEYNLYIGSSSNVTLNIDVKNIASSLDNRAYNTFIKVDFNSKGISPSKIYPGQYKQSPTGLIYAVVSPLEVNTFERNIFVFSLTNDFIQSAQKYIYLNISLEAMSPQPYLKPIILKIRVRMVADIELKASVTNIDQIFYNDTTILGISAITDEKKVGPQMKIKISLSNMEHTSVVVSSKLVIYFPWEVAGDPSEPHGQYLLYLQHIPKFFISGGKRNISCDEESLKKIVNPIRTKTFEPKDETPMYQVSLGNIPVPKNLPKFESLKKDISIKSNVDGSSAKSSWENNVLLDCMNGTARCIPIICDMGPLSRLSGEINIHLDVRVWIHTFLENFIKYKYVLTEIPVFWVPESEFDIVLKKADSSFTSIGIKADNFRKPKAPPSLDLIWAVLIAICIGIIVLATLILILYKCKFFRREKFNSVRKRRKLSKQT